MSERANYFKIGLFIIAATVLVIAAIIILGAAALFQEEVRVETYFQDSVQGLDIGSPVKFRGVQIGRVETMTLVGKEYETDHRYVLVRMALLADTFMPNKENIGRERIERMVGQGLRMRLGFQGLTGAAYVEADFLDPERYPPFQIDWKPKYAYIPAAPSIITRIGDAVDGILRNLEAINIQGIAGSLDKTLQATSRTFQEIKAGELSDEMKQLLTELRQTNRHIDRVVTSIKIDPVLQEATAAFRQLRVTVEKVDTPLQEILAETAVAAENLRQITSEIEEGGDLKEGLAHLRQAMRRLDQLITGQQPELEAAIGNLRALSENLRQTSEDLKTHPSQVLFGAPPPQTFPGGGK